MRSTGAELTGEVVKQTATSKYKTVKFGLKATTKHLTFIYHNLDFEAWYFIRR